MFALLAGSRRLLAFWSLLVIFPLMWLHGDGGALQHVTRLSLSLEPVCNPASGDCIACQAPCPRPAQWFLKLSGMGGGANLSSEKV